MDPRPPIHPVYAYPPPPSYQVPDIRQGRTYWGTNTMDEQQYTPNSYSHAHSHRHPYPAQGPGYYPVPGHSMGSGEPAVHPTPHMYSVPDDQPSLIHTTHYYPNQPHRTSGAYTPEYSNAVQPPYMQHGMSHAYRQPPPPPQHPSAPLYHHAFAAQHPHSGPHEGGAPAQAPSPQITVPPPAPAPAVPPSRSSAIDSQAPLSQAPPSRAAPLTSQLSFTFVAESPGNPTTKLKSQRKAPARRKSTTTPTASGRTATKPPLHPAPSPVGQGEDNYHVPEGSTVESLLASGFVPPLTAIGDNLVSARTLHLLKLV